MNDYQFFFIELGITNLGSEMQFSNMPFMLSMDLESSTLVILEQPENKLSPIFVTESGISICFSEVQPINAPFPILIAELGISISFNEVQF